VTAVKALMRLVIVAMLAGFVQTESSSCFRSKMRGENFEAMDQSESNSEAARPSMGRTRCEGSY